MTHDSTLTPAQRDDLRTLAGMMIPASATYDVPGADDPAIQAEILATLGRDAATVRAALDQIAELAGQSLAVLDSVRRDEVVQSFRNAGGSGVATLSRVILQCYYRDDRVLRSLNLDLRAPFPKGYTLEQGDWTLLEPVKRRSSMWRRVPMSNLHSDGDTFV